MDTFRLLLSISILLVLGRVFERILGRYRQPAIIGQLITGILMGASVFGQIAPESYEWLYGGPKGWLAFEPGFSTLAGVFLLLLAGMKTGFPSLQQRHKATIAISIFSFTIPFAFGMGVAFLGPFLGINAVYTDSGVFSFFIGTAFSLSALTVSAKAIMDLKLIHTRIGKVSMAVISINDVLGWMAFSIILMAKTHEDLPPLRMAVSISLTLLYCFFMVFAAPRLLKAILARLPAADNLFPAVLVSTFVAALLAESIGVHSYLGALLSGMCWNQVGRPAHAAFERVRDMVYAFFAPLFFSSLALRADFIGNFNWKLILIVFITANISKFLAGALGGRISNLNWRETLSISAFINARGAVVTVISSIAFSQGIIGPQMYVALIVTAIATSAMIGPIVTWALTLKQQTVSAFSNKMPGRQSLFVHRRGAAGKSKAA